jgi:hypothetical protein
VLRFRLPADAKLFTTLHVLLASNYLGSGGSGSGGGVPFCVAVRSPDGERRAPVALRHPTGLPSGDEVSGSGGSSSSSSSSSSSLAVREVVGAIAPAAAAAVPRRLLCVDGGGSKGVIPLESLAEVCVRLSRTSLSVDCDIDFQLQRYEFSIDKTKNIDFSLCFWLHSFLTKNVSLWVMCVFGTFSNLKPPCVLPFFVFFSLLCG